MSNLQNKSRRPLSVEVPGLSHDPTLEAYNFYASQMLDLLDARIGFGVEGAEKPPQDAQAARQRVRGALTEAVLWAYASVQHAKVHRGD